MSDRVPLWQLELPQHVQDCINRCLDNYQRSLIRQSQSEQNYAGESLSNITATSVNVEKRTEPTEISVSAQTLQYSTIRETNDSETIQPSAESIDVTNSERMKLFSELQTKESVSEQKQQEKSATVDEAKNKQVAEQITDQQQSSISTGSFNIQQYLDEHVPINDIYRGPFTVQTSQTTFEYQPTAATQQETYQTNYLGSFQPVNISTYRTTVQPQPCIYDFPTNIDTSYASDDEALNLRRCICRTYRRLNELERENPSLPHSEMPSFCQELLHRLDESFPCCDQMVPIHSTVQTWESAFVDKATQTDSVESPIYHISSTGTSTPPSNQEYIEESVQFTDQPEEISEPVPTYTFENATESVAPSIQQEIRYPFTPIVDQTPIVTMRRYEPIPIPVEEKTLLIERPTNFCYVPCQELIKYVPIPQQAQFESVPVEQPLITSYQPITEYPSYVEERSLTPIPEPYTEVPAPTIEYTRIPTPIPSFVEPELPELPATTVPTDQPEIRTDRWCIRCCCKPGQSLTKKIVYRTEKDDQGYQGGEELDFSSVWDQMETRITVRIGNSLMEDGNFFDSGFNEQLRVIDFPTQVFEGTPFETTRYY